MIRATSSILILKEPTQLVRQSPHGEGGREGHLEGRPQTASIRITWSKTLSRDKSMA
jgi:hypothetical protein